jgi:hypothetical protein
LLSLIDTAPEGEVKAGVWLVSFMVMLPVVDMTVPEIDPSLKDTVKVVAPSVTRLAKGVTVKLPALLAMFTLPLVVPNLAVWLLMVQ